MMAGALYHSVNTATNRTGYCCAAVAALVPTAQSSAFFLVGPCCTLSEHSVSASA